MMKMSYLIGFLSAFLAASFGVQASYATHATLSPRPFAYFDPNRMFIDYANKADGISYGLGSTMVLNQIEFAYEHMPKPVLPDLIAEIRQTISKGQNNPHPFPELYGSSYFRLIESYFANHPEIIRPIALYTQKLDPKIGEVGGVVQHPWALIHQSLSRLDEVLKEASYQEFMNEAYPKIKTREDFIAFQNQLKARLPDFKDADYFPGEKFMFYTLFGFISPSDVVANILFPGDFAYRRVDQLVSSARQTHATSWAETLKLLNSLPQPKRLTQEDLKTATIKLHSFPVTAIEEDFSVSQAEMRKQLFFWDEVSQNAFTARSSDPAVSLNRIGEYVSSQKKRLDVHTFNALMRFFARAKRKLSSCGNALEDTAEDAVDSTTG